MKKRQVLCTGLAAALLVTSLAGCGKKKTEEDTGDVTLTYWAPMTATVAAHVKDYSEITYYKELENRTGIKVNYVHPPVGQQSEQFNLMLASGTDSLYDMIEYEWTVYPGGPDAAVEEGIIYDLTDMVDKYAPNFKGLLDKNENYSRLSKTDEGRIAMFPMLSRSESRVFGGLMIRQDWLDDLGLAMPETIEDWETVLTAFKEKKGATSPLTMVDWQLTGAYHFNNAFDVGNKMYVDNGKIAYPQLQPRYKDYLALLHSWYEKGLLDPDYNTNTSAVVDAKMTNGQSGVTYGYIGGTMGRYVSAMKDKDPNYKLSAAQFPKTKDGKEPRFIEYQLDVQSPYVAVTTNCKHPETAVKWLDYIYSEEGSVLKSFGVEGDTYNMVDGHYKYTDKIMNNPDGLSIADAMNMNLRVNAPAPGLETDSNDYFDQYYTIQEQKDALKIWGKYGKNAAETFLPPITSSVEEKEEILSLKNEIDTYVAEAVLKFIKGQDSLDNYDAFVAKLKAMGIDRMVELYQTALDRFNNR